MLQHLSTIVRNTCRHPGTPAHEASFTLDTARRAKQLRALELLKTIAA
ncbi:hypothetical protein [Burkholderia sp. Ac-20353]|nr:hypothetical protein [Burkholderia sp. Ac-20353]MBN3786008.1 hypothetical protein [Burkholderia sp. Ac-20353]